MTPEQLDEIEKLARDPKSAAFHDLMARQTIPLVKALREALAHNEKLIEELKETDVRAAEWLGILEKMERERDEARAEVERLRSVLRLLWEEAQDESRCHLAQGHMISQPCWEEVDGALKEGDR